MANSPNTSTACAPASAARLLLAPEQGWVCRRDAAGETWFKGYVVVDGRCAEGAAAAEILRGMIDATRDLAGLGAALARLDGSYAVVRKTAAAVVAAVDRMRSIPLFYARADTGYVFDDRGRRIAAAIGLRAPDADGCLDVAMAGYATGDSTLYAGLKQIRAGELVRAQGNDLERCRYYAYTSWVLGTPADDATMQRRLRETTLSILEKTAKGLAGRPVMLPLSAGFDSRLIASGLRHLGYRDVRCYAYGRPGNYEAEASRAIAERLGYGWTFVPYSPARVRALAATGSYADYLDFADSCASVPFLQDLLAITELKRAGKVPAEAIFINGNSGDFISGNHIHSALHQPQPRLSWQERVERVIAAYIDKHFSLWRDLRHPANDGRIRARAHAALAEHLSGPVPPEADHGLYEFLECQERQAKFVISGQRVYEYFGHAWRLPLWDNDYLDFWRPLPLRAKAGQRLYRQTLEAADWGGVWRNIPVNAKFVSPAWVRPLRNLAKLACAPLGERVWRQVEKRMFVYWTDLLSTYAAAPYRRLLFDRRGFRNAIAIRSEAYLAEKALGWAAPQTSG